MIRRFARPYGKAVLDVAGSPQRANTVRVELEKFEQARHEATDLQELYANPGIDLEVKFKVTHAIASRMGLSDLTGKVLEVLIRNHRINQLDAIVSALASMVNEQLNVAVVEVRSAHKLTEQELAQLRKTLEQKVGKRVEVHLEMDPSLIGGFVARIGSEVYDASVAGKIHKFRESLS
ncbi:MAG TPA: ATP synthase F1 subunit delta [Thermoanaerobaculia bacterium]|nr:ATP synthase F1 subunit delta [Thermoanaerobaculia bacterium]